MQSLLPGDSQWHERLGGERIFFDPVLGPRPVFWAHLALASLMSCYLLTVVSITPSWFSKFMEVLELPPLFRYTFYVHAVSGLITCAQLAAGRHLSHASVDKLINTMRHRAIEKSEKIRRKQMSLGACEAAETMILQTAVWAVILCLVCQSWDGLRFYTLFFLPHHAIKLQEVSAMHPLIRATQTVSREAVEDICDEIAEAKEAKWTRLGETSEFWMRMFSRYSDVDECLVETWKATAIGVVMTLWLAESFIGSIWLVLFGHFSNSVFLRGCCYLIAAEVWWRLASYLVPAAQTTTLFQSRDSTKKSIITVTVKHLEDQIPQEGMRFLEFAKTISAGVRIRGVGLVTEGKLFLWSKAVMTILPLMFAHSISALDGGKEQGPPCSCTWNNYTCVGTGVSH
eukprot:TRINITY_DN10264_c0_g2_i2.p1 TRINITY_DN10264_c0_g2~~TRINITY_DN10264_c0_g2_i2.p1  ORF type:complete len:399 (+),score=38.76 TRINITY_DN10264_c0_g2_i2:201-1397(+)